MSLHLHEYNEKEFSGGCLAYLGKAYDVAVTEHLQQPHTLSFSYPMNDEKAELITEHRIVSVEGQAYRLDSITRTYENGTGILKAEATRIFFADAILHHIPTIGNDTDTSASTIGVDPYKVARKAIENTPFELIPDSELTEKGMTRIGANGVKIDFFPTDKINPYDVILNVIAAYGRGELYVDNYRFAVVEHIGSDNGVRLTLTKNLTRLSIQRQTAELCTRLYMYGKDDMTISSVNGGKPYIDSPNIDKYGTVEGYKDYPEYTDPQKLKDFGTWDLMGEDNILPLDKPQLTITADVVDLSKLAEYGDVYKMSLGDTVRVYEDKTEYRKRIISIKYYPYSSKQPVVTIGAPTLSNPYYAAWCKSKLFQTIQKNSGRANRIKTNYFSGTVNSTQNPVQSKNKKLLLDGDLLYINDRNDTRRINLGNVDEANVDEADEEFVFELFNKLGIKTLYVDTETGNAIFSGTIRGGKIESDTDINVNKDACVGRYLRVGYISSYTDGEGDIHYIYYPDSGILMSEGTSIRSSNSGESLDLYAASAINLYASRVMVNKKDVLTEADLRNIIEEIETLKGKISNLENK